MSQRLITPDNIGAAEAERVLQFLNEVESAEEIVDATELPNQRDVDVGIAERLLTQREECGGQFTDIGEIAETYGIGPERFDDIVRGLTDTERRREQSTETALTVTRLTDTAEVPETLERLQRAKTVASTLKECDLESLVATLYANPTTLDTITSLPGLVELLSPATVPIARGSEFNEGVDLTDRQRRSREQERQRRERETETLRREAERLDEEAADHADAAAQLEKKAADLDEAGDAAGANRAWNDAATERGKAAEAEQDAAQARRDADEADRDRGLAQDELDADHQYTDRTKKQPARERRADEREARAERRRSRRRSRTD